MGYFKTRGLRGSSLEELINFTNELFKTRGLAVVQKIPTPITPVDFNKESRTISLAYFESKSTVDYIGVAQGIPICFDAKDTAQKSLPIQNIHEHQIEFMRNFEAQSGVAFLLVHFTEWDEFYYLPFPSLLAFWENSKNGGRKSIPHDAFEKRYLLENGGGIVNYLKGINTYLADKEREA